MPDATDYPVAAYTDADLSAALDGAVAAVDDTWTALQAPMTDYWRANAHLADLRAEFVRRIAAAPETEAIAV